MSSTSYASAVAQLYRLQSNQAVIDAWKAERLVKKDVNLQAETKAHLGLLNVAVPTNVVHIAGSKGKGSTVAMTEALLRAQGLRTGAFISPHLISPRERIRLNGKPISEEQFAHFFWKTYGALKNAPPPPFFRFLNCMAFLVFQEENVEVAVVEVGVGGRTCSTNVVEPNITGITALGFDHMDVLGNTMKEIAHEKAGIIKMGVPCISARQPEEGAMEVSRVAAERGSLVVKVEEPLDENVVLGLEGSFQRHNAAQALLLARYWVRYRNEKGRPVSLEEQRQRMATVSDLHELTTTEREALKSVKWPGRAHTVGQYFIDGAHTEESVALAMEWFQERSTPQSRVGLLFNFKPNKQVDAMMALMSQLEWDVAVVTTSTVDAKDQSLTWQRDLKARWPNATSRDQIKVAGNVRDAMTLFDSDTDVLVVGSLYLVGAMLEALNKTVEDLY